VFYSFLIAFSPKVGLLLLLLWPFCVESRHWFFDHYWFEPKLGYVRQGTLVCSDISSFYELRNNVNKRLNRWHLESDLIQDGRCRKLLSDKALQLTGYGNKFHSLLEFKESDTPPEFWWVRWIDVEIWN